MSVVFRVPGKVMLAGEYSVLYAHRALAFAVDCWARVEVSLQDERGLWMESNLWDAPQRFDWGNLPQSNALVSTIERLTQAFGFSGLAIKIDSQIALEYGMGSSSALRLGIALALTRLADRELDEWAIVKAVVEDQARFQGIASGYDVAVQLCGGLRSFSMPYSAWPEGVARIDPAIIQDMSIFVGGKGAPTRGVLNDTLAFLDSRGLEKELAERAESLIAGWEKGLKTNAYPQIGAYRDLFWDSPHFPRELASKLKELPGCDRTFTFKFTGAGGEDAILLFGQSEAAAGARRVLTDVGWFEFPFGVSMLGAS